LEGAAPLEGEQVALEEVREFRLVEEHRYGDGLDGGTRQRDEAPTQRAQIRRATTAASSPEGVRSGFPEV
jgi:hypothetical protein